MMLKNAAIRLGLASAMLLGFGECTSGIAAASGMPKFIESAIVRVVLALNLLVGGGEVSIRDTRNL